MPLPIQNLYTGQGAAVVLPQGDRLSQAASDVFRGQDMMNEVSYRDALRRQDQLINMSSIELENYLSPKFMEEQADLIEGFQNEVSSVMADKKGELSTKDLMDIQRKKAGIQGLQAKRLAEDKYIVEQKKRFELFPEKYDRNETAARLDEAVYKGNIHPDGLLVPKTVVWSNYINDWWRKNRDIYPEKDVSEIYDKQEDGSYKVKRDVQYQVKEARLKDDFFRTILDDDTAEYSAKKDFLKLDETEQDRYIDEYGENAILEYVWDRNKQSLLDRLTAKTSEAERMGSTGGGIQFQFGGSSKVKKGAGFNIKDNVYTNKIGSGKALVFEGGDIITMAANVFEWPEGYDPDKIGNVSIRPDFVVGDKFEGTVTLKNQPVYRKEITEDEWMGLDDKRAKATEEVIDGQGNTRYYLPIQLDRTVTVSADLDMVRDNLSSRFENFDESVEQVATDEVFDADTENKINAFMQRNNITSKSEAVKILRDNKIIQ